METKRNENAHEDSEKKKKKKVDLPLYTFSFLLNFPMNEHIRSLFSFATMVQNEAV